MMPVQTEKTQNNNEKYSYNTNLKKIITEEQMVGAPLAGITSPAFRKIIRKFFKGLIFTEMISVEGIRRKIPNTLRYLPLQEEDYPISLQLFGSNPESFSEAIKICEDISSPNGYDLNAGCPVKKVIKAKSGSYLLKDLKNLTKIVKAMRKATKKPISVKTRIGWDKNSIVAKEILLICENEGVDFLTVHARTKTEMFGGEIHYEILRELSSLKKNVILIGNGDITDYKSFEKMMNTGVDAVMLGRAMMKSPWCFQAIRAKKEIATFLSLRQKKELLIELMNYMKTEKKNYVDNMKKFAVWFLKGYKNSSAFRKKVFTVKNEDELINLLEEFVE